MKNIGLWRWPYAMVALMIFTACDSWKRDHQTDEGLAPLCNGTVTVAVNNVDTKAADIQGNIDRYTATRCDVEAGNLVLVSYHGRNREQIGMVQVVRSNDGRITSELITLNARVNYAIYRKDLNGREVAYVGVDREGPNGMLCGIIAVPMENYRFKQDAAVTEYTPYKVEGQSVNCIKTFSGANVKNVIFVAAGGNEGLSDGKKAGFTKFGIDPDDPTRLSLLNEYSHANYRGYWFSYDYLGTHPIAYTYRTVNANGHLEYRVSLIQNSEAQVLLNADGRFFDDVNRVEAVVHTNEETNIDLGRFGVSAFNIHWPSGNTNYIVVSTGNKEGGVQVFRHVGATNSLQLVDTWHKACGNTSSLYTSQEDGRYYIYASAGQDGVFKLEIVPGDEETRAVRLEPVAKRVTNVITESGTASSSNYVQLIGSKVHVAGGYEGYFALDAENDSQFIPADKRVD